MALRGLQLVGALLVGTASATAAAAAPRAGSASAGAFSGGSSSAASASARLSPAGPTPTQRRAMVAAVHASPLLAAVPPSGYNVTNERVSHRDRTYAFATVVPTGPWADPALVELRRRGGHWVVTEVGTAGVGCGAPTAVRAEMGIVCH